MQVLLDTRVQVSTRQTYVLSGDVEVAWDEAFEGQSNGLLGAARPGLLTIGAGVHSGDIGMRVVLADQEPPVGAEWEDVVEVSFIPLSRDLVLADMITDQGHALSLEVMSYRVRMSVRGMDAGSDADVVFDDDDLVEFHEIVFWPAPPAPDAVVRQGSELAAVMHQWPSQ